MIRRPPRSTQSRSSAASDVYKRQLEHEGGAGFEDLLQEVTNRIRGEAGAIEGALIEPKKASVAVHYRLVSESQRPRIKALVDVLLAEHPDELKVTPGKM